MRCWIVFALALIGSAAPAAAGSLLLVTTQGSNKVLEYDAATYAPLGTFATTGLSTPEGIAVGPDGNVYVANYGAGNVTRYGPTGTYLGVFASGAPLSGIYGLTFGPDGNLYVANYGGSGQVERFNGTTGAYMSAFTTGAGNPLGASSAIDLFFAGGFLYVADYVHAYVRRFNAATGAYDNGFGALVPQSRVFGIARDSSGNLYASPYNNQTYIEKYNAAGTDLGSFTTPDGSLLNGPTGLLFAANGDLIVGGGSTNKLLRFSAAGALLSTIDTGYSFAYETVLNPVPEPGALALLAAGAALLARRRRAG